MIYIHIYIYTYVSIIAKELFHPGLHLHGESGWRDQLEGWRFAKFQCCFSWLTWRNVVRSRGVVVFVCSEWQERNSANLLSALCDMPEDRALKWCQVIVLANGVAVTICHTSSWWNTLQAGPDVPRGKLMAELNSWMGDLFQRNWNCWNDWNWGGDNAREKVLESVCALSFTY